MKAITLILFFFISFLFNDVLAQENDPEIIFSSVRSAAELKKFDEAILQIETLISNYPKNLDYSIYLIRLQYWSGNLKVAQSLAENSVAKNPTNAEVFALLVKIELALENYPQVLAYSNNGISLFPNEIIYYNLHKALALEKLKQDEEAMLLLNEIPKSSNLYQDAQYLKTQILKKQKNIFSLGYLNTSFSSPGFSPWHFGIAEYLRINKNGVYVGRITNGNLFGISALQAEIDAYPRFSKNSYLFLNGGFSDGKSLFPTFRLGAEFFYDLKKYNFSLGSRYLHFSDSKVLMFTGHTAIYFNQWKLSYRPFLVNLDKKWFPTHILNLRKIFENKEAFIQFDLQYGALPYYFFTTSDLLRLNSLRSGIDVKFRIHDNYFLQTTFMYELEEFIPSETRNRYNIQLNLSKRF